MEIDSNNKKKKNGLIGIASLVGDTALVAAVTGHLDVAFVSPAGSPRVLDKPVIATTLATVSNGQNSVVDLRAAVGIIEDTWTR